MKKITHFGLTILAFIVLFISSCTKDDTTTPSGTTDARDQFEGTWNVTEKGPNGTMPFRITFSKETSNQVYSRIKDFNNLGDDYFVRVIISYNNISIPEQISNGTGGGFTIKGSGQLLSNQITMSYTVDDGTGSVDSYTATCVR